MPYDSSERRQNRLAACGSLPGRRILPHAVGLAVLLHLIAVTLMAVPAPGEAVNRQAWADPTVQAELSAWSAHARRWGVDVDPPGRQLGLPESLSTVGVDLAIELEQLSFAVVNRGEKS